MERAESVPTVEVEFAGKTELFTIDMYEQLARLDVLPDDAKVTLRTEHFTDDVGGPHARTSRRSRRQAWSGPTARVIASDRSPASRSNG